MVLLSRAFELRFRLLLFTLALAAVLVAMWYAAAAQTNGAVYLLAFACAGMALLSWLHAKANLRDIDIQAGDLVLNQRAGCYRLPFRLMARSRRAASGIEIAANDINRLPLCLVSSRGGQLVERVSM
mgnify:CR=1 FL=1